MSGIFELGQITGELDAACFATAAGVNLRLHHAHVGVQLARPTWRLEGPDGSYHLQEPTADRERFPQQGLWERLGPGGGSTRDVGLTSWRAV